MDWVAVGAVGEIVGAAGVIISLIYLARQIQQSTRAMKAESARAAVAAVREFNSSMIADPAVAKIFRIGAEGMAKLTPEDRARFAHVALNFFKTAEDLHYQFVRGTLEPDVWQSWKTIVALYAKSPGFQEYWRERSQFFTPAFRAECESWRAPQIDRVAKFAEDAGVPPVVTTGGHA